MDEAIDRQPLTPLQPVLEEISVAPEHQRRHIGKRLVNWGLALARMKDCRAVVLALDKNVGFYERQGFSVTTTASVRGLTINGMAAM